MQDALLSESFSAKGVINNSVTDTALVTLRQRYGSYPCRLHSYDARYPLVTRTTEDGHLISSTQQQVSCSPAVPSTPPLIGDWWKVVRVSSETSHATDTSNTLTPFDITLLTQSSLDSIKHGDALAFVHVQTNKALNSHDIVAPISNDEQEVSCYGDDENPHEVDPCCDSSCDDVLFCS
eukprot:m.173502 g.173502  ORF g.173502 m.173502 type:complete len:179 (-) comp15388_c0_seq16:54-590(-)